MSGIKPSICKFYNRKTFITEILNVTTHPPPPSPSHEVVQSEGRKRDKGDGGEIRRGSEGLFPFSLPGCFGLPNPVFQEVKSNQKSSSCPIMYFALILCQSRERTQERKRQKDGERLETTLRVEAKWLSPFVSKDVPSHFILLRVCSLIANIFFCVL